MKRLGRLGSKLLRILIVTSALTTVIILLDALLVPEDDGRPRGA
jgi:hypothetical protein